MLHYLQHNLGVPDLIVNVWVRGTLEPVIPSLTEFTSINQITVELPDGNFYVQVRDASYPVRNFWSTYIVGMIMEVLPEDESPERVWWCAHHRQVVDFNDLNSPPCGPDLQCTGGRRQTLPCGWYLLIPEDESETM